MNNVADLAVNTEVVTIAAQLLLVAAIFQISDDSSCGIRCSSRATDVKIPMYITFVAYWVVGFQFLFIWECILILSCWNMDWTVAGLSTAFILYIRFNILTKLILENQGAL
jgi:MATE family multidrug resistance protein